MNARSHLLFAGPRAAGLIVSLLLVGAVAPRARATVFHSKASALKLAFPGADSVKPRNVFLTAGEHAAVQRKAGSKLDSRMVTAYVGMKAGRCLGYAIIDTHRVRSMPETLMIVLTPGGQVQALHVLAFHEPRNYLARPRWLAQFKGRSSSSKLRINYQIAGIAGLTLTAHAVTRMVRRMLAIYAVALKSGLRARCPRSP